MKKLLGIIEYNSKELFLFQENGSLLVVNSEDFVKPDNYYVIKNRDYLIGNEKITGSGVFNFRYGPVTGGVAEAGVYNIYTSGEKILSVEIDVSFKKRDIEKRILNLPVNDALSFAENVCGNFAFSHSLAYTRAVEKIFNINIDKTVQNYRVIALELERIYNHLYVIAELAKGAAQKVLTSHLQYLFEECLRLNEIFSGTRHLLKFNRIGGISKPVDKKNIDILLEKLNKIEERFSYLYEKSLESGNYLDRLHNTGIITQDKAVKIGLTGPSLRASGIEEDLREFDNYYNLSEIPVKEEGDSLARMEVRAEEIFISIKIIKEKLEILKQENKIIQNNNYEIINGEGFAGVESPSGTICYYLVIENNKIKFCHITTPSTSGFKAIADSLAGQIFTDFVFTVESFGVNFADAAR